MKHGEAVAAFEAAFAEYVGARYAIACSNGTVTLQGALHALGVQPGDRVATTPLTMSATTIAILNVGAVPVYCDVTPNEWVMGSAVPHDVVAHLPVALYGLHGTYDGGSVLFGPDQRASRAGHTCMGAGFDTPTVVDAAQTLSPHYPAAFTSYSFQASKILPLGEGGMLCTNDEDLAAKARSYLSLGYRMKATQARIDSAVIKSPTYERHHLPMSINGRMNDLTASWGLNFFDCSQSFAAQLDELKAGRRQCAALYAQAIAGCDWLTPQHVPEGWSHDYWAYAVAIDPSFEVHAPRLDDLSPRPELQRAPTWEYIANLIEGHGGERPYGAWRLTYHEPAFRHLAALGNGGRIDVDWTEGGEDRHGKPVDWRVYGTCPVAESLQPRLLQFQTNDLRSAERNANALKRAIEEVGG